MDFQLFKPKILEKIMQNISGVTLCVSGPAGTPSAQNSICTCIKHFLTIKFWLNHGNCRKNPTKMYLSSAQHELLLVLQLSFQKNVQHFGAISPLPPPETVPHAVRAYRYTTAKYSTTLIKSNRINSLVNITPIFNI